MLTTRSTPIAGSSTVRVRLQTDIIEPEDKKPAARGLMSSPCALPILRLACKMRSECETVQLECCRLGCRPRAGASLLVRSTQSRLRRDKRRALAKPAGARIWPLPSPRRWDLKLGLHFRPGLRRSNRLRHTNIGSRPRTSLAHGSRTPQNGSLYNLLTPKKAGR